MGFLWLPFFFIRVKNSRHNDVSEGNIFGGRNDFFTLFFFYSLIYLILYTAWMARASTPNLLYEGKKIYCNFIILQYRQHSVYVYKREFRLKLITVLSQDLGWNFYPAFSFSKSAHVSTWTHAHTHAPILSLVEHRNQEVNHTDPQGSKFISTISMHQNSCIFITGTPPQVSPGPCFSYFTLDSNKFGELVFRPSPNRAIMLGRVRRGYKEGKAKQNKKIEIY